MLKKIRSWYNNNFPPAINETNSSMGISCTAPRQCEYRHTGLCDKCKNNVGPMREESFFAPRKAGK